MHRVKSVVSQPPVTLAYFITSHGFGHATRACAVMTALHARHPDLRFEVFTQVPRWVFDDSLTAPFSYHALDTDVGLVQTSSMVEDLPQTLERLNALLPFRQPLVKELAEQLRQLRCAFVLCDIAPLGIAVATAAGVSSLLIENFTWDWIYETYAVDAPRLRRHIEYLRETFAEADYHIQTAPVCLPRPVDLTTRPVSRNPRTPAAVIRERLGIPRNGRPVLITMGGIEPGQYRFLEQLAAQPDVYFVIPGGSATAMERRGNVVLLAHRSQFFHPDLLNACDAVVGKLGYSTMAEAYRAGVSYGYVPRDRLRESAILGPYAKREMDAIEISLVHFEEGRWLALLPDLLSKPRAQRETPNGATEIAAFVGKVLK